MVKLYVYMESKITSTKEILRENHLKVAIVGIGIAAALVSSEVWLVALWMGYLLLVLSRAGIHKYRAT